MKLRRALATAAATAAIAPLSLMAAGIAVADGAPAAGAGSETTQSASDTTPSDDTTTGSAPTSGTDADGSDDTTTTGDDTTSSADTGSTADGTGDADGTDTTGKQPSGTVSPSVTTPGSDPTVKEPTDEPSDCPVDDNGDDIGSALTLGVSGLPGKIVAGSGWHPFTLTAANHSDQSLGTVQWFVLVDNDSLSTDEKNQLSNYTRVQYLDPKTKKWTSLADVVGNGISFGETDLGAKKTVDIKLRLDITAEAPAGAGFTVGLGGYLDEKQNCVHSSYGYYEFTVLKPGSSNEDPGQATPVDKGDKDGKGGKPAGGKKPQGGAAEIPVTGSLAETGSSSMLPTIGLVGGVAVVAGAGAVFAVRRRRSGSTAV